MLGRAREKGLDGDALRALGEANDLPAYVAAGLFLEQYLDNLDQQSATDYSDLIRRAVIEADVHRDELRARLRHVFVDEYQDTDPAQVRLLQTLAGDGRDLTVVGDPHQSIYAFRGAEVRGILDFPDHFPRGDGTPADVIALAPLAASARGCSRPPSGWPVGSPLPVASTPPLGRPSCLRWRRPAPSATDGSRS